MPLTNATNCCVRVRSHIDSIQWTAAAILYSCAGGTTSCRRVHGDDVNQSVKSAFGGTYIHSKSKTQSRHRTPFSYVRMDDQMNWNESNGSVLSRFPWENLFAKIDDFHFGQFFRGLFLTIVLTHSYSESLSPGRPWTNNDRVSYSSNNNERTFDWFKCELWKFVHRDNQHNGNNNRSNTLFGCSSSDNERTVHLIEFITIFQKAFVYSPLNSSFDKYLHCAVRWWRMIDAHMTMSRRDATCIRT